jgi:hypothetical protein
MICKHLIDATGRSTPKPCVTCRGNTRIKYAIYNCAVHQFCLPTYDGTDDEMMTCHTCRRDSLGFEPKEPSP